MSDALPNSPATSRRLSAMLDTLLDISTALGTVREHQRLTEIQTSQHAARLASVEARTASLEEKISISKAFTPSPPMPHPTSPTRTTPPSMATSPPTVSTGTATDTTLWRRILASFTKEGLKEAAPWLAGQLAALALRYGVPIAWALWLYSQQVLKWMGMLWRGLIGG